MSLVRQRLIRWVYGDGFAALVAAAATDRALAAARASLRKEPETLDVSRLRPGETYEVVARPAPGRRLRAREARLAAVADRLERAERPSRRHRRAERRLARAESRLASAAPGTRRHRRAAAERDEQARRVARLAAPDARTRRLRRRHERLEADVARRRARLLAGARARARPPRRVTFR